MDKDSDGSVTVDELHEGLTKIMNAMDHNNDGHISKQELTDYVAKNGGATSLVEQLIKTLDADGDGQISKAEFEQLIY